MDTFWGLSSTFWGAVEALGVWASTVIVCVTLWFIYRQVRTAAKSFEHDAVRRLQDLVDMFREDRAMLYANCPLDLVVSHEQFSKRPPLRRTVGHSADDARSMALTPAQSSALQSISEELKDKGRHVIEKLNDIGHLLEDGFIDRRVFFGKYHVMVIQCCHLVEAIRREEEAQRGGNYGQRLLRMRHRAMVYNDIWPKHRAVAIKITRARSTQLLLGNDALKQPVSLPSEQRIIYQSPQPTLIRRLAWAIRRWFSWY